MYSIRRTARQPVWLLTFYPARSGVRCLVRAFCGSASLAGRALQAALDHIVRIWGGH